MERGGGLAADAASGGTREISREYQWTIEYHTAGQLTGFYNETVPLGTKLETIDFWTKLNCFSETKFALSLVILRVITIDS